MSDKSCNVQAQEGQQLKKVAGPLLLWGLGVGYVISGDYFGWNFGLAAGGFWGLFAATILMAIMYTSMCLTIAELSTAIPFSGGAYAFARRAMGPWGGYLAGIGVVLEYVLAPAVIVNGIAGYVHVLFPDVAQWMLVIGFFAVFLIMNTLGAKTTLNFELVVTAIAVVGLGIFAYLAIPHFDASKLTNIAPTEGNSKVLPFGLVGIWAAIPYAIWLFLAIEGLPLVSEECKDPAKDMPKGLISSISTLVITAFLVLFLAAGNGGADAMSTSASPLPEALAGALGQAHWSMKGLALIGLAGLIASFNGIIFGYGRAIFSLSRAGYLPRFLSAVHPRFHTPYVALLVGGAVGIVGAILGNGDVLIQIAVFGAVISYIMMMLSAIVLRKKEPNMPRPYKVPLYPLTPYAALILAIIALFAGFFYAPKVILWTALVYAIFVAYFAFYSRHHLVAKAPEEEFELLRKAEEELG
ncbi:ethanolamine:proton symporter, EAT family [Desulforamulus reducens MI-1]|uniref:Ethanolamine:proton symporter, EAT family n=1 Tax=Desulforamulus reducens (strain ATCC BAA-1160 / DSM 100696 / MI-1) TaxID=349161 RepID=A4J425_DESRM|nr:ethanolamine permease [Desulforamulus reducens]ABO49828.1 ethanolamine:proton symporter, EAT family [Desulforamulus reducens MI-1]